MIAASIIIKGKVKLINVPLISDIYTICKILEKMGAEISWKGRQLSIDTQKLTNTNLDFKLISSIRASVVLIGPLLARFGKVAIPHPGGDKIGPRPINEHIQAFKTLGANVKQKDNIYYFELKNIFPNNVEFGKITVTGTENILLFASSQVCDIKVYNVAIEPEIIDLINFLNKAGAKIDLEGRKLHIQGNNNLQSVKHTVIPDRIETATFATLGIVTKSNLKITNTNPRLLKSFWQKLTQIGVQFELGKNYVLIKNSGILKNGTIRTGEHPAIATDLQPLFGLIFTQAEGESRITENIFDNRLGYLKELSNMGANVKIIDSHNAIINGPTVLIGRKIDSLDIRAGATLIIAGLIAKGNTEILAAENIDRGYEKIEERLQKIGAKIKRA